MRRLEKEEEACALENPDRRLYHLCIVNLVIGPLYCAKGNFQVGVNLLVCLFDFVTVVIVVVVVVVVFVVFVVVVGPLRWVLEFWTNRMARNSMVIVVSLLHETLYLTSYLDR